MTEKTAPWWRSFVGKRRKAARESAAKLEQDLRSQTSAEFTQHPSADPDQRLTSPTRPAKEADNCLPSDETYDDSAVQPTFNESSNRRNLTVSRSGRFKEKRKTRASLPQNHGDDDKPAAARSTEVQSTR
ncbi:proline-rich 15-like protein [Labeo rohita]|uniref:Proline-rich 15-like protein n=1 Tax=Labeo rohita TaxID=84645 RepID=A0A498N6W9_LABRO|nr:proline-rich protein 15 [Labeo rohita]RXN26326.1 proline-rich 15-like protein [Labeo rohita]